ncbi:MAG: type II toxin-antitoxin system VapC family toxin [Armatimonadetes bacterium]|nr:type II toxin-antitoxin system VapC family toxin [Armatimonadota bacterium]
MIPAPVFIDSWGWIALGHKKEPRHDEIDEYYRTLREKKARIYTSDYVLDEVITLIFRREIFSEALFFVTGILKAARDGYLTIETVSGTRFAAAWDFRTRFEDKPRISFTDITSVVIMAELGIKRILTEDAHFQQLGKGFQQAP